METTRWRTGSRGIGVEKGRTAVVLVLMMLISCAGSFPGAEMNAIGCLKEEDLGQMTISRLSLFAMGDFETGAEDLELTPNPLPIYSHLT
jgi:hypothetical protein